MAASPEALAADVFTLSAPAEIVTTPAVPDPTPESVPTDATPRIGDEDLLEPARAPEVSEMSVAAPPVSGALRMKERHPASEAKRVLSAQGRTFRRALYAAASIILLAAGAVAGLHFGVYRLTSAQPAARKPEIGAHAVSSNPATIEYVVKKGDTLWDIAAQFTGNAYNFHGIAGYNGITDPNLISPGQIIRLPPDFNKKPGAPIP
jgi:nucleoid-associated protein YgaU